MHPLDNWVLFVDFFMQVFPLANWALISVPLSKLRMLWKSSQVWRNCVLRYKLIKTNGDFTKKR
jgi:hypothetical protein